MTWLSFVYVAVAGMVAIWTTSVLAAYRPDRSRRSLPRPLPDILVGMAIGATWPLLLAYAAGLWLLARLQAPTGWDA